MISRTRFALTFFVPSVGAFAGVLVAGMLTLGAEDCVAQPPEEVEFSIENYGTEEDAHQVEWARYLQNMEEQFGQVEEFEELPRPPATMVRVWSDFLKAFAHDDPFSEKDDKLRKKAKERLAYWQTPSSQETPGSPDKPRNIVTEGPEESPDVCLAPLESPKQLNVSGDLRLGRVFLGGDVMEPVLIRKNVAGYSFRRCSNGKATEIEVAEDDLEFFNSALVARFVQEKSLTTYREVQSLGYEPNGEVKLAFRDASSMLEARRLGDEHVEVTIFPQVRVTILLVATRTAMELMEPRLWEESWGDQPEDSRIEREIIWWELASPVNLRVHPAVESFEDLASLLVAGAAAGTETDWSSVLEGEDLKTILAQATLSLFIAEQPEHIGLAEKMLELAISTGSDVDLDIGTLEDRWKKRVRPRLEEAASWGRYLPLVRLYDLAAIMPDRIAGKIRQNYHQSLPPGAVDTGFKRDYVILARDPRTFQVANALYLDQASEMVRTISFFGCLLDNGAEASSRRGILEKGLERISSIPLERLEEMDIRNAFQYLFQGFILPSGLRAGERSFLRSISRGDPEVMRLVQSFQSYFDTTSLEPGPSCEIALIPDSVLIGPPFYEPLLVVPGMQAPEIPLPDLDDTEGPDAASPADRWYADALLAKNKARIALKEAIYAKAAVHTKGKIEDGHKQLDKGTRLLNDSNGVGARVRRAIKAFEKAESIFLKAKETAFRIEHTKPKLRVP